MKKILCLSLIVSCLISTPIFAREYSHTSTTIASISTNLTEYIDKNTLDLSGRNVRDKDIPQILTYLYNHPDITGLNLGGDKISDEGAIALAANTTLTSLELGANSISAKGAAALAKNKILTSLDLSINHIGDDGAAVFATNTTLATLALYAADVTDKGVELL